MRSSGRSADAVTPAPRATRRRLPASSRVAQIQDAALRLFSHKGFAATRIDDIAAAAGLSKGGVYTHFKSKEDIFEALLARLVVPAGSGTPVRGPGETVTVDLLVEQVIDPMYAALGDPGTLQTLRLLFADGAHMPERVARWRTATVDPQYAHIGRLVRRGVKQGSLRHSVLAQASWLLIAPGVHAMWEHVMQAGVAPRRLAAQKKAHIAMLRELLEH